MSSTNSFSMNPEDRGDAAIVYCTGRLTAEHCETFKTEVRKLINRRKQIALDLQKVDRMDSSGLGAIVGLYISAKKQDCVFELVNYGESIRELLGMAHLLSVFEACGRYGTRMP